MSRTKTDFAKGMRRAPTPAEATVWGYLRNHRLHGLKWRRQHVILGFIADFYCAELRVALELDGDIHDAPEVVERDALRDQVFLRVRIRTMRLRNEDCTRVFLTTVVCSLLDERATASVSRSLEDQQGDDCNEIEDRRQ